MGETEDRIGAIQKDIGAMVGENSPNNTPGYGSDMRKLAAYNVELAAIIHKDVAKFQEETNRYVRTAGILTKASIGLAVVSVFIAGAAFYASIRDSDKNSKAQTEIIQSLHNIDQKLQQ